MHAKAALTLLMSMLVTASTAMAQDTQSPNLMNSTASSGRLRFGIDGVAGLESVSSGGASVSGPMFGVEGRIGWQLNDLFAVYAEPHLTFGSIGADGISGSTSTFVGTLMGEATFQDQFFAGAGVGYGILNNPSGFAVEVRGGWYALRSKGDDGVRRKGLFVGANFRSVFVSGGTGILVLGSVGYEFY